MVVYTTIKSAFRGTEFQHGNNLSIVLFLFIDKKPSINIVTYIIFVCIPIYYYITLFIFRIKVIYSFHNSLERNYISGKLLPNN